RYRQPDQACTVQEDAPGRLEVRFDVPQRAVAPGQYAVFYAGDRCLGGAVIDVTRRQERTLEQAV
ncbi:MAG: tRNA 2-thiouridine(34) synthase MnmA, partial [Gammaproteobacteria bacterium]|nr:tRNA 2-thiouridine(34) synthase MnmA [Gammaproteobacteria bacterium]